jgi:hypothetical protein
MTSILLADLFGLENLSNSFGMLLIFQGVATLIGPAFAGKLPVSKDSTQAVPQFNRASFGQGIMRDYFKSYTIPFVCLGSAIAISGLMCFFIPIMQRRKKTQADSNP